MSFGLLLGFCRDPFSRFICFYVFHPCAWLTFLSLYAKYSTVFVIKQILRFLLSVALNIARDCTGLLYQSRLTHVLFSTGTLNPDLSWVQPSLQNPVHSQVHTISLNPNFCLVHMPTLLCVWYLTFSRVYPFSHTIFLCTVFTLNLPLMYSGHLSHGHCGRMCWYWRPLLAISKYDRWFG